MIHIRIHTPDGQHLIDPPIETLRACSAEPNAHMWVDLESPSQDELQEVAAIFGLMDVTVEDLDQDGQRAKLESFDTYNVLILHAMRFDSQDLSVEAPELDIVLGRNYLITSHKEMPEIMHDPRGLQHTGTVLRKGPTLMLYHVVDRLVDSYYPVMDQIDETIELLQDRILQTTTPELLEQIFALRHSLSYLRKVVSPQIEVFNRLIAREDEFIDPAFAPYFRDVYDHLIRTFEVVDSYRDLMSNSMDAYLSMVSNRQNDVMKRLTAVTTIFLPITFLTGLFGQNFRDMPQVQHDNGYLWWFIFFGMVTLSVAQALYYRKIDWL